MYVSHCGLSSALPTCTEIANFNMPDYLSCGSCPQDFELSAITEFIEHKKTAQCTPPELCDSSCVLLECFSCERQFNTPWPLLIHIQHDHQINLVRSLAMAQRHQTSVVTRSRKCSTETQTVTTCLQQNSSRRCPYDNNLPAAKLTACCQKPEPVACCNQVRGPDWLEIGLCSLCDFSRQLQPSATVSIPGQSCCQNPPAALISRAPTTCSMQPQVGGCPDVHGDSCPSSCSSCKSIESKGCQTEFVNLEIDMDFLMLDDSNALNSMEPDVHPAVVPPGQPLDQAPSKAIQTPLLSTVVARQQDQYQTAAPPPPHAPDILIGQTPLANQMMTGSSFQSQLGLNDPPDQQLEDELQMTFFQPAPVSRGDGLVWSSAQGPLDFGSLYPQATSTTTSASFATVAPQLQTSPSTPSAGVSQPARKKTGKRGKDFRFACGECAKPFRQNVHLRKHVMAQHTKLKPHKCPHCRYTTVEKSHLTVHIRTHTGEKPFRCRHCTYSSAQNCTLKSHFLRRHPGSLVKCNLCPETFITEQECINHQKSCRLGQMTSLA